MNTPELLSAVGCSDDVVELCNCPDVVSFSNVDLVLVCIDVVPKI